MNQRISRILVAAVFAATVSVQAFASVRTKAIIVEFPSDLPEQAQTRSEAMFLHHTGAAQAILYLEQDQGRKLAILDVTDPANIRPVGVVSIDAKAPYDFVQTVANYSALIHYRNHSGFAIISFKNYKEPVLKSEPEYLHPATSESAGANDLLLVSSSSTSSPAQGHEYEVVNISNPSSPTPLATIQGVTQRLDRPQTGTIFLLNDRGLTVVRCLAAEREHQIEADQKSEN